MKETTPKIHISKKAIQQIHLILDNDYTITEKTVRLSIDGKGCGGFDYAIGFDKKADADTVLQFDGFELVMDKFCSYYCPEGEVDYLLDINNDVEGFMFTNSNEKKYRGKFFKDESKAPDPESL